jgi:hypothetical protein
MNDINLLNKLTNNNKHLGNKYNKTDTTISLKNTLFILDWDDTLFPTTWATRSNINLMNNNNRNQYIIHFQELDRVLSHFLKIISECGKIVIVTNAMADWVKISSIVMPKTYNIVKKINIVSARGIFSPYTKDITQWKKLAFQMVIKQEFKHKPLMNVISIGDAEYEHMALVELSKIHFDKIKYLKSFRLIKSPSHDQLVDQLNVLSSTIQHMWDKHSQICKTFTSIK